MKKKITYITFKIEKSLGFEWVLDGVDKNLVEFSVLSICVPENTPFQQFCEHRNIPFYRIEYTSKKDILKATYQTYRLLKRIQPDAVHCHIFEANLIGLTAALFAGIPKRIFTRHHSSYHYDVAPNGRKYDLLCNKMATHIVSISENVSNILIHKENVPPKKIYLIHHGFKLDFFYSISEERIKQVQEKYNPTNQRPVIGVISRYTEWKGIIYILQAFQQLLTLYPNALLVLANAKGDDKLVMDTIQQLPKKNFVEIVFEPDNAALFKLFDVFVHVPIDAETEAFGQIYVEALAVGVPSVFTLSGVAREFVVDKQNAWVVDFKNSEQIYTAISTLLEDKTLAQQLAINGKNSLGENFSLDLMIQKLEQLYTR